MTIRIQHLFVVVLIFAFFASSPARANNSYSNSYFGRHMPEYTYRQFNNSLRQRVRHEAGLDSACASGELFFEHLATHEDPDFSSFAAGDVNSDPVGVIWSQLLLAEQGPTNELRTPDDFRKFHLAITLWNAWYSQPDSGLSPEQRSRMLFDAYRRLKSSSFLVETSGFSPYSKFFYSLFSQIGKQIAADDPAARAFLSDWVQAKVDIGRWEWDPELQEALKDNGVPNSYFPAILNFRPILAAAQKHDEEGMPVLPEWLLADLVARFQNIGSRIGTALLICDPHGNASPSLRMIELARQGKQNAIYLQDPFRWIDIADYLLLSAESLAFPQSATNTYESIDAPGDPVVTAPSVRIPANRRSISDLRGLGFLGTRSPSDMTEEERVAFCVSWQKEAKQVLAQFQYMLNILALSRHSNPDCFVRLWNSKSSEASPDE